MVFERTWQQNRAGLMASLLLHGLAFALWLSWSLQHAPQPAPPLKAMLVDLVKQPVVAPGLPGGASQVARPRQALAPKILGVNPKAATPPPDVMEARIAALATLTAPAS